MEARVAVLEEVVRRIDAKLDRMDARFDQIDARLHKLDVGVAELRGMVGTLPTAWQMVTAIVGGQIALAAMLFGAARLLGVHG